MDSTRFREKPTEFPQTAYCAYHIDGYGGHDLIMFDKPELHVSLTCQSERVAVYELKKILMVRGKTEIEQT